jgi:type III pantothenate kinase
MKQTILCLDVGNSDIYGGVCRGEELLLEFRKANYQQPSADEFGVFLLQILQAHGMAAETLDKVAIASVVPGCNYMLLCACEKYLSKVPLMVSAGIHTGLQIRTKQPSELGADRIATAMAAVQAYPSRDRVVIDMGTATTFCAIDRESNYLGGVIAAGIGLSMRALAQNTAKLPHVDLQRPQARIGTTTLESIQLGWYLGHLGLISEVVRRLREQAFAGREPVVLGTGGHARFFVADGVFTAHVPDLVLRGLCRAVELNPYPDVSGS